MVKLRVEYCPNDNLLEKVCDGQAEKYVFEIVKGANNTILLTSQEMVIDYVRLAILRNLISNEDVEFVFGNIIIFADRYGHLDSWPQGFCDYRDKLLEEFLRGTIDKFELGEQNV